MKIDELALASCPNYERTTVEEAVGRLFAAAGGVDSVVVRGESVFLKVNAMLAYDPKNMATTHPEIVRAVALKLREATDNITIGDNPGNPFGLERVYETTGFADVARETGCKLYTDTTATTVTLSQGASMKSFQISGEMLAADRLISLPKLKTHVFMNVTCAIKNLFGTVPGANKFNYHGRFPDAESFSDMLVDVALASRSSMSIVDAVIGMEGDGPRMGEPTNLGFIAAGSDPFHTDLGIMKVLGLDAGLNFPLAAAIKRGLCPEGTSSISILGDDSERLPTGPFNLPLENRDGSRIPPFILKRITRYLSPVPEPVKGKCTRCGRCMNICPRDAISLNRKVAVVNQRECIKCYCCFELCEEDAIRLRKPPLMRLARM